MQDWRLPWLLIIVGLINLCIKHIASECASHTGIQFLTADELAVNYFYSPGTTKAPNYTYYDNQFCEWQIKSDASSKVVSLHVDVRKIEPDPECQLDNVTVYDGEDNTAKVLLNLCGSNIDRTIHSSSRYLYVTFTSNQQHHFQGFLAKYKTDDVPRSVTGSGATLGATIGSIAAGTLVIGAICCCCLKKGIKSRTIKPSTTFRFGNRGGLFGQGHCVNNTNRHNNTSTTRLCGQTRQPNHPRPNVQSVFHVQSGTVRFDNTPLQPTAEFQPPPPYSSLGSARSPPKQTTHHSNQNGSAVFQPDSSRSGGPISPSGLQLSEPPRYSSIAGPKPNEYTKVPQTNSNNGTLVNQSGNSNATAAPSAPPTAPSNDPWSPPPPYNYNF